VIVQVQDSVQDQVAGLTQGHEENHLQAPIKVDIATLAQAPENWTPQQTLTWAFKTLGTSVAISSAFGAEGMVLIDMASRLHKDFRLFTIDTEFLFPETYNLMDRIEQRYGITIERVFSEFSPEAQERTHGTALWASNPDQCCNLRKVEPLRRKLGSLSAWITSIRRDQTSVRSVARRIEWDSKFGLLKINPIVDWSSKQVWRYIHDHDVPYNELHNQDYPSIGCTHCTRAVKLGEDPRAGRWSGFAKTECGLHAIEPMAQLGEPTASKAAKLGA
jgi:phosphoadenosine phosphosulfate reductase